MKMIERNKTVEAAALLIHPMLSSAEGIELCVTDFWGDDVRCFLPDLSSHGEAAGETYHSAWEEAKAICGDKDPYLKSHPEYRDEAGYRRNR